MGFVRYIYFIHESATLLNELSIMLAFCLLLLLFSSQCCDFFTDLRLIGLFSYTNCDVLTSLTLNRYEFSFLLLT